MTIATPTEKQAKKRKQNAEYKARVEKCYGDKLTAEGAVEWGKSTLERFGFASVNEVKELVRSLK